jgi:hypothetical protein
MMNIIMEKYHVQFLHFCLCAQLLSVEYPSGKGMDFVGFSSGQKFSKERAACCQDHFVGRDDAQWFHMSKTCQKISSPKVISRVFAIQVLANSLNFRFR